MELKRIPKNTVIKGEEHWCHLSNAKEIDAPQINSNEVHLPCIGSIAIPRSTSYTTDVTFFTKIQRFHETPISSLEEHQFQESLRNKDPCTPYRLEMRADSLSSTAVISHLSRSTSSGFSLSYMYVTGTMCFLLQVKCTPKCPDLKEGQISLQRLNAGSSFIS